MVLACALSGGIDQFGMFLALSVLLVIILNYTGKNLTLISTTALLLTIWVAGFNSNCILNPYSWWGYRTATVSEARVSSEFPYSKGLYSDRISNLQYSELIKFTKLNRRCSNTMLTYPSMTSFGLDAGYTAYNNQVQYWFDFTSKRKVIDAMGALSSNRPSAILYTKYPSGVAKAHAQVFNDGEPLPQQELEREIVDLIEKEYVSKTYDLYRSDGYSVTLAIKKSCLQIAHK
jgi:hypothetical protein